MMPDPAELKRLFRMLAAKKGKGDFLVMEAPADVITANELLEDTDARMQASGMKTARVDAAVFRSPGDLLERLRAFAEQGIDVVHITGGAAWLRDADPNRANGTPRVHVLNILRENFFRVPVQIALWLPQDGIATLATEAPDFWSWRGGVYKLSPDEPPAPKNSPSL